MTREELYASIYTHDTIYLPPWEEQSAPLEVALGCSWGKCRFCDFAKDTFSLHSDEKIEENLTRESPCLFPWRKCICHRE